MRDVKETPNDKSEWQAESELDESRTEASQVFLHGKVFPRMLSGA
jgi:hypothetical protein